MWALVQLGVFLFTSGVPQFVGAIQSRFRRQGPAAPFQTPVVPAGTKIPVVFGTWRVRPITVWFGGAIPHEVVQYQQQLLLGFIHFAPTVAIRSGYEYSVTMMGLLGWGPMQIRNIIFGEKLLSNQPATTKQIVPGSEGLPGGSVFYDASAVSGGGFIGPGALDLEVYSGGRGENTFFLPDIYGGPGHGGGVKGLIRFAKGSGQYGPDPLMVAKLGAGNVPSYNLLATVVYDDLIMGESPTPPPIDYIAAGLAASVNARMIGPPGKQWLVADASAAEILRIGLVSPWFGQGEPEWKINLGSFNGASETLFNEKLGMSLYAGGSSGPQINSFQDLREECERHAGGILRENAATGQWEFVLLRDESASFSSLPQYNENHFDTLEWNRTLPDEVINRVTVEFSDAEQLYQPDVVTLDNAGNIAMTGNVRAIKVQYLGCTDRATAWKLCARELRERTSLLGRGKGNAIRALWSALPGDVIRLSNGRHKLNDLMVRVIDVDLGVPEDPHITVTLVEDVFSLPTAERMERGPELTTPAQIIRPTITAMRQSVAAGIGTLEFTVLDPEHRTTSVAARRQTGTEAPGAFETLFTADPDTSDPLWPFVTTVTDGEANQTFTYTVPLSATAQSAIQARIRYIGYSPRSDPLADIQEVLSPVVVFPVLAPLPTITLYATLVAGVPTVHATVSSDVTLVKFAASYSGYPPLPDVRTSLVTASAEPFDATFPAIPLGTVLDITALAYDATGRESLPARLAIPNGATSGTAVQGENARVTRVSATTAYIPLSNTTRVTRGSATITYTPLDNTARVTRLGATVAYMPPDNTARVTRLGATVVFRE